MCVHAQCYYIYCFCIWAFFSSVFIELLMFYCKMYWMFYVNVEPEGRFLYTETIKLYCSNCLPFYWLNMYITWMWECLLLPVKGYIVDSISKGGEVLGHGSSSASATTPTAEELRMKRLAFLEGKGKSPAGSCNAEESPSSSSVKGGATFAVLTFLLA